MSVLRAVREKCLDCMCGNAAEVRRCPCTDCSLFPFRMGHNPNRVGTGNAAHFAGKPHTTRDSEQNAMGV